MFYEIKMREQYLEAEKRGEIRGKIEGEEVTARLYVNVTMKMQKSSDMEM